MRGISIMEETISGKTIRVKVFRFEPNVDRNSYYKEYVIPFEHGMSAMDALDYIYQSIDRTIAYYDHAGCNLGICARCTARVNGKPCLLCQTEITGDIVIEPVNEARVVRDIVMQRNRKQAS
jgi:succinate dehydrogenase/fumarate reductase-like Fe-S protein